ncbi:hypothetical protein [uncultured Tateyamaria sp.]|uniref:hypothetical protein n=1 Tax=uncultured Tateyamaria sp. TaxID=455651 RepID=UPI002639FE9D|nr:hypothetical protein [uncultured Tateyamaria sp.]
MGLADAISGSSEHDLADLTAFIVAECEMCTQDADGSRVDIDNDDVIAAFKAWAGLKRDGQDD